MVASLHESNGQRWRATSLTHVQSLVKQDPTILRRTKYSFYPLCRAVSWGARLEVVRWMWERNKDAVHWVDGDGWTLLHVCAQYNYFHLVPFLLWAHRDEKRNGKTHLNISDIQDKTGLTPLDMARLEPTDNAQTIPLLENPISTIEQYEEENGLSMKIDPDMIVALDEYNNADKWPVSSLEHVRFLVERDPGVLGRKNEFGWYPLRRAVVYHAKPEVIKYLAAETLVQGADPVDVRFLLGEVGSLHETSAERWSYTSLEQVKALVSRYPDALIKKGGYFHFYPVRCAEENRGSVEVVTYLKRETKKRMVEHDGVTEHDARMVVDRMLPSLTSSKREEWMNTTLEHFQELVVIDAAIHGSGGQGDDAQQSARSVLRRRDRWGCTPMYYAVKYGVGIDIIEWIASVDESTLQFVDKQQWTLLHHAVEEGHNDIIPCLLSNFPAAAKKYNNEGKTPLDLAIANGNEDMMSLLSDPQGIIKLQRDQLRALKKQLDALAQSSQ